MLSFAKISRIAGVMGLSAVLFAGCGDEDEVAYVERAPETIYDEAQTALETEDYEGALVLFDEVERQHPYSSWARRAVLMGAFSAYQDNNYSQAIASAERYLQLYPSSKDAPYALYLMGISQYEQITDVTRDQSMTDHARQAFTELVRRYPDSEYGKDARLKLDLTLDHLAGKEMSVGRYYLTRGQYVGAINRFRTVVDTYQTTSHTPEALHRLVESYLAMGIRGEAQTAAAVLGLNYPGSPWYADSYLLLEGVDLRPAVDEESWLAKLWGKVF